MPRTIRQGNLTAALAAVAALTVWLAPHATSAAAPAQSGTRFALSPALYRVSEGDGIVAVDVSRTGDTSGAASVEYLASSGYLLAKGCGHLTWVGTATPDSDYTRASGTLHFAAGETTKTFNVSILEDTLVESRDPETTFLSLDFSHLAPPAARTATAPAGSSTCTTTPRRPRPRPRRSRRTSARSPSARTSTATTRFT